MSKLEANRHRPRKRPHSVEQSIRLTKQTVQETEHALEVSRELLDQPIYPDRRTPVPKTDE